MGQWEGAQEMSLMPLIIINGRNGDEHKHILIDWEWRKGFKG